MKQIILILILISTVFAQAFRANEDCKFLYKETYIKDSQRNYCVYIVESSSNEVIAIYDLIAAIDYPRNSFVSKNTVIGYGPRIMIENIGGI